MKISKIENKDKKKFSNAKNFYYTIEGIEDCDGNIINLLFTKRELLVAMEYAQAIPSLSQAQRIRQLSKEKQLSLEKMEEIMCEVKKGEITRVAFTNEQLHKYFPNSYTPAMMKREILALLKLWKKESWES